jgi:hypothetical protein
MGEDNIDPKQEEKWQNYLRRRKRGKRILLLGTIILVSSSVIALLPGVVAAFSGTSYVPTGWEQYLTLAFIFGLVLIFAGFLSMISPNMIEGDALWVMKMGPFPSRG